MSTQAPRKGLEANITRVCQRGPGVPWGYDSSLPVCCLGSSGRVAILGTPPVLGQPASGVPVGWRKGLDKSRCSLDMLGGTEQT